jgi:hypothetical protein
VFGKTLKLETGDNKIITFSTKMADEILWASPRVKFGLKMLSNTQA